MSYAGSLLGNNLDYISESFDSFFPVDDMFLHEALDPWEVLDLTRAEETFTQIWDKILNRTETYSYSSKEASEKIKQIDRLLKEIQEERKKMGKARIIGKLHYHGAFLKRMAVEFIKLFDDAFEIDDTFGGRHGAANIILRYIEMITKTIPDNIKILWDWVDYDSFLDHNEERLKLVRKRLQAQR